MLNNHFPLAFLLFLFAFAACEDEPGCVTNDTNLVNINFYQIDDTTQRNLYPGFEESIEGFVLIGSNGNPDATIRPRTLPLDPSQDASTFLVVQANGNVDTITLAYRRQQRVISPDCGPTQQFTLDSVWSARSSFDDYRIVEPELSESGELNLEIYVCQDTFYTQEIAFNFQEKEPDTTIVRTDSLFIQSIQNEAGQVLLANDTVVGNLSLPINPSAGRTTFTFELLAHRDEPARTETITLTYRDTTFRFAEPCRLQTRYFDLDTAGATFDSVRFENRELAIDVPLNIRIVDFL